MKKVFFSNSGAEANECAIKTARKYSHDKYGDGRHTIITLKNSFHGRTLATLTACGQESLHQDFGPFVDGFVYAEADNLTMSKTYAKRISLRIMMEMVQGEGGVHPLDKDFVKQVAAYAKAHDILIVVDEVQTGNGRTGYLYAYMGYGIEPDIVSTAKASGGRPALGRHHVCRFDGEDTDRPYPRLDLWRQPDLHSRRHSIIDRLTPEIDGRSTEKGSVYQRRTGTVPTRRPRLRQWLMIGIALRIKT